MSALEFRDSHSSDSGSLSPNFLIMLKDYHRHIYLGVYIIITVASLIGNFAAIYSVATRNYRCIQKTCIISLALSDIFSTITITAINMVYFTNAIMIWPLGTFLCSFLPMCQMVAIFASSTALMFIAMDRYRNVVYALTNRWNPRPWYCIGCTVILWLIGFGISSPIYTLFENRPVTILMNKATNETMEAWLCLTFWKDELKKYYIAMVVIIFLPLLCVFLWFYYNIAALVWKHRKPFSSIFSKQGASGLENSSSTSKTSEIPVKNLKNPPKSQDIRVERKIRTFKIIIALMIVFIICRLPYFAIEIMKFSMTNYGLWTWHLIYSFMALHIVNCCLNPLLYTFLNQTLKICVMVTRSVRNFTWEICCFCCSSAVFEDLEKENPFVVDNYEQQRDMRNNRHPKVKFDEGVKQIEIKY